LDAGFYRAVICSGHRKPFDRRRGQGRLPRLACGRKTAAQEVLRTGLRKYGRLARSDEHSPGVAVPGSESGHAIQIRRRTEYSRFQARQPLAVQEVEAGPVDGREVEPDGIGSKAQTEGSYESCRVTVAIEPAARRRYERAGTCLEWDQKRL